MISDGSTTLQIPMPAPASAEPANSALREGIRRTAAATISTAIAANTVRSMPKRAAQRGASGATRPKTSTGRVVSRPVTALLQPVAALMSPTRGATATTAGRRLAATTMIATAVSTVRMAGRGRSWVSVGGGAVLGAGLTVPRVVP